MSFFELDGGNAKKTPAKKTPAKKTPAKKTPAKKTPAKKTPAKKTPAKKTPAKKAPAKKTKKGGNFLGTVSELFAPAGWENFVTAAGLLALDRTDNYLRKKTDSKKQKGGDGDEVKMEEEMTGGAHKKMSYSRKQRGGSDGHHTIEALDMMSEEPDMTQTGGENNTYLLSHEQLEQICNLYNSNTIFTIDYNNDDKKLLLKINSSGGPNDFPDINRVRILGILRHLNIIVTESNIASIIKLVLHTIRNYHLSLNRPGQSNKKPNQSNQNPNKSNQNPNKSNQNPNKPNKPK